MSKIKVLATYYDQPNLEWHRAFQQGVDMLDPLLNSISALVRERGDSEDLYELEYLRFLRFTPVPESAVRSAKRMLGYTVSRPEIARHVATIMHLNGENDLALAHLHRAYHANNNADIGERFYEEIQLCSLELAVEATLAPTGRHAIDLQVRLRDLMTSTVLPTDILIDAFERLNAAGTVAWFSRDVLSRMGVLLGAQLRTGDTEDPRIDRITRIINAVPSQLDAISDYKRPY